VAENSADFAERPQELTPPPANLFAAKMAGRYAANESPAAKTVFLNTTDRSRLCAAKGSAYAMVPPKKAHRISH